MQEKISECLWKKGARVKKKKHVFCGINKRWVCSRSCVLWAVELAADTASWIKGEKLTIAFHAWHLQKLALWSEHSQSSCKRQPNSTSLWTRNGGIYYGLRALREPGRPHLQVEEKQLFKISATVLQSYSDRGFHRKHHLLAVRHHS